jgi:hypothetical protein
LVKNLTNIRQTRKQPITENLTKYLSLIVDNLGETNQANQDWRMKEALMHAFGLLAGHMANSPDYVRNAELLLQEYAFTELKSENGIMRSRACWIYG